MVLRRCSTANVCWSAGQGFIGGHASALTSLIEDDQARLGRAHAPDEAWSRASAEARPRPDAGGPRRDLAWIRTERLPFYGRESVDRHREAILVCLFPGAVGSGSLALLLRAHHTIGAAIFALLPIVLLWRWYRPWLSVLLCPLAIYGILPVIGHAFLSAFTGRRIEWKGRSI